MNKFFAVQSWKKIEIWLAVLVVALLLSVLTSNVGQSGAWDGDPALRNRLAMETVNKFVLESQTGGHPATAFLQSFHRYPTMLHEAVLASFILAINGIHPVTVDAVTHYAAWFATLWTIAGLWILYLVMRRFASRTQVLLALPICALGGYILFYANFPRQNMAAHAAGWIAFYFYLKGRSYGPLSGANALAVGLLYGVSVALHYSSAYLLFALLICELIFALIDRRQISKTLVSSAVICASAASIWFAVDLYYYLALPVYPGVKLFDGTVLAEAHYSFLAGLVHSMTRLSTHAAQYKLEDTQWWFWFGFIYRNFGLLGSCLVLGGFIALCRQLVVAFKSAHYEFRNAAIIVLVTTLVSFVISLGYFQNARKLMVFYPAWCVLLLLGFILITSLIYRLLLPVAEHEGAAQWGRPKVIVVAVLLLVLHFTLFASDAKSIYQARRDVGYMREYLAEHGIDRVLVYGSYREFTNAFAPEQKVLFEIPKEQADQFDYVLVHKLIRGQSNDLMKRLRGITPVATFPNQASLPLFWYEFPLKPEFFDPQDPLSSSRLLYRWRDVREAFYPNDGVR